MAGRFVSRTAQPSGGSEQAAARGEVSTRKARKRRPVKQQQIRDYLVLDRLSGLGEIDPRPMFDGFGLFHDGHFFGIVQAGQLYLKTFPETVARYEERGMAPFAPSDRTSLKTYYQVPPDVLDDPPELCRWAREAFRQEEPPAD